MNNKLVYKAFAFLIIFFMSFTACETGNKEVVENTLPERPVKTIDLDLLINTELRRLVNNLSIEELASLKDFFSSNTKEDILKAINKYKENIKTSNENLFMRISNVNGAEVRSSTDESDCFGLPECACSDISTCFELLAIIVGEECNCTGNGKDFLVYLDPLTLLKDSNFLFEGLKDNSVRGITITNNNRSESLSQKKGVYGLQENSSFENNIDNASMEIQVGHRISFK